MEGKTRKLTGPYAEGVRGVRSQPPSWANYIKKSYSFSPETELTPLIIASPRKGGGYTGFALSFRHSVVLSFCHNSDETWISLRPVGQSWSNFIWRIIRMGERLHKVLGQIGSKLWFPWQQKVPTDLQWGKRCRHLFSVVFYQIFFRLAGKEDRHKISDKFQFLPLPTELDAHECLKNLSNIRIFRHTPFCPFIFSFFNTQKLKILVTLFSGTVRPRRLQLGAHVDNVWMYFVYWNQSAAAYLSLYFFILLSLQFSNIKMLLSHFSQELWGLEGWNIIKRYTHMDNGWMNRVYRKFS